MTKQWRRLARQWHRLIGLSSLIGLLLLATACDTDSGPPAAGLLTPTIEVAEKESPYLFDVSMGTADDGWAVGVLTTGAQGALVPNSDGVMLHYTGGHWNPVVRLPKTYLNGVAMISADDGWAVGGRSSADGIPTTVIMHYTGGQWQEVPGGQPGSLNNIEMVSASDGWAVGSHTASANGFSSDAILLHYTGGTWTPITSPVMDVLASVDMISADEGWIVGGTYKGSNTNSSIILHYTGGSWTQVSSPTKTPLLDVSMSSATDGWAVGEQFNVHYHDGAWERTERPGGHPPRRVVAVSPTEAWAVGGYEFQNNGSVQHYIDGAWTLVDPALGGGALDGLDLISDKAGWAVGQGGTIVEFRDGDWLPYTP